MAINTIYPPSIEGILPAFIKKENGKGQLIVPFTFNSATTLGDWDGAVIKVKTIQEDVVIAQAETANIDLTESWAIFDLDKDNLGDSFEIGVHYKVQLALKRGSLIGWFSSVGVIKCTSDPIITILGGGGESADPLEEDYGNQSYPYFIGVYTQATTDEDLAYTRDINERVYSSYFEIYTKDSDGNKISVEKSDEFIHNATLDESLNESREEWFPTIDLNSGEPYYIRYFVTTINNLQVASPEYPIYETENVPLDIPADLEVQYDEENGVAALYFHANAPSSRATGRFVISRKDLNLDNNWRIVYKFALATELPDGLIWRDFTVEQGATYAYAIQQFNESNVYTGRKIFTYYNEYGSPQEELTIKFDHMYLFDGEKQLKVKFNPQVSSFKEQLFEQKVDTIGSKYPFFFRNAMVGYKTFPISGLISMLTDDDELFTTYEDIERLRRNASRNKTPGSESNLYQSTETDLTWKNIESERLFKLKVLDWLNDGKLKLFRSPQEGNYLVRLMENSLTPTNELGRMLHTFNSVAYEADNTSYNSLLKHGIINIPTSLNTMSQKVKTINFKDYGTYSNGVLIGIKDILGYWAEIDGETRWFTRFAGPVTRIDLADILPGTQFLVKFRNGLQKVITIGKTGAYTVKDIDPIIGLQLILPVGTNPIKTGTVYTNIYKRILSGSAQIYYNATSITGFDAIAGQKVDPNTCVQILDSPKNFPNNLSNIMEKPVKINLLKIKKKDIIDLYALKEIDGTIPTAFLDVLDGSSDELSGPARELLYYDRDCLYKVLNEDSDYSKYNILPNALYRIRLVNREHLPYDHGVERFVKPMENVQNPEKIDTFLTMRDAELDYIDRRSGDLFWQNDNSTDEDLYYLNYFQFLYDAYNNKIIKFKDWEPFFIIDSTTKVDLREIEEYKIKGWVPNKDFTSIYFGNGVYAECYYQNLLLKYVWQNDQSKYFNKDVYDKTVAYENALSEWTQDSSIEEQKNNLIEILQEYYDDWISLEEE